MKESKLKRIFLLLMLSCLFTTGFSSWTINNNKLEFSVDVAVGEVIDASELFTFESFQSDSVCSFGFVKDETVSSTGEFYFNFSVNKKILESILLNKELFVFNVVLSCLNNNSILTEDIVEKVFIGDTIIGSDCVYEANDYSSTCKCSFKIPTEEILSLTNISIGFRLNGSGWRIDYSSLVNNLPKLDIDLKPVIL